MIFRPFTTRGRNTSTVNPAIPATTLTNLFTSKDGLIPNIKGSDPGRTSHQNGDALSTTSTKFPSWAIILLILFVLVALAVLLLVCKLFDFSFSYKFRISIMSVSGFVSLFVSTMVTWVFYLQIYLLCQFAHSLCSFGYLFVNSLSAPSCTLWLFL